MAEISPSSEFKMSYGFELSPDAKAAGVKIFKKFMQKSAWAYTLNPKRRHTKEELGSSSIDIHGSVGLIVFGEEAKSGKYYEAIIETIYNPEDIKNLGQRIFIKRGFVKRRERKRVEYTDVTGKKRTKSPTPKPTRKNQLELDVSSEE